MKNFLSAGGVLGIEAEAEREGKGKKGKRWPDPLPSVSDISGTRCAWAICHLD
jgi:hypothetical protein